MSYLQSRAIRTAVKELLHGSIGTTRVVPPGLFEYGVFTGQAIGAQKARALDLRFRHRFDVTLRTVGSSVATPLSVKSSYRLSVMRIEILVTTKLPSQVVEAMRDDARSQVEGDCDVAIQALNYPHNLLTTHDAEETGIISGMFRGPDGLSTPTWELLEENWEQQLLRSRIIGDADVMQTQAVA